MTPVLTWINTGGTLVAIATSLFLLRQGQKDRRQVREDRRREQATRLTAWPDWVTSPVHGDADRLEAAIFVYNASDQVALDVFVDYRDPARGGDSRISFGAVPPRTTSRLSIIPGALAEGWEPAAAFPRLYFQDIAGARWYRTSKGVLRTDPWPSQHQGPVRHLWKDEPQQPVLVSAVVGR
ncbi:MAG: hypothetical protein ABI382_13210 [Nakamurella sp.]